MKRYRQRNSEEDALVGETGEGLLDPLALFARQAPLRLEIGFGHGHFLSQMAACHPDEDFIGVEAKGVRVNKCAHKSVKLEAENLRLFSGEAHAFLRQRIPPASLKRCYVLFPDPWPRSRHRRRRLVNRSFLLDLAHAMAPGGRFIFASDAHDYVMQVLSNSSCMSGCWHNRYAPAGYRFDIPTRFTTVFQRHKQEAGCAIGYLMLERTQQPAPERAPWRNIHLGQGFGIRPDGSGSALQAQSSRDSS